MAFSACVVNHDGERYLDGVLGSLRAQSPPPDEILLIDNASRDGGLARVAARHPEVRVCRLATNRGPGAARNTGLRLARHDRILFADCDVVLDPACARRLMRALDDDPAVAAAMPRLFHADRPNRLQLEGADCHYLGLMTLRGAERLATPAGSGVVPIGSLVTACFVLDRGRIDLDPPFDERFFIYLEDHDFAFRVRTRGGALVAVPAAACLHREGTPGLSMRPGRRPSRRRLFLVIRNRWLFLLKNLELRTLVLTAPALAAFEAFQLVGVTSRGALSEWLRAVAWLFVRRREIAASRAVVQARRRARDRALLIGGPVPIRSELTPTPAARAARRILNRLAEAYWRRMRTRL